MDTDGSVIKRSNKQVFMQLATNPKFLAEWSRDTLIALVYDHLLPSHKINPVQSLLECGYLVEKT